MSEPHLCSSTAPATHNPCFSVHVAGSPGTWHHAALAPSPSGEPIISTPPSLPAFRSELSCSSPGLFPLPSVAILAEERPHNPASHRSRLGGSLRLPPLQSGAPCQQCPTPATNVLQHLSPSALGQDPRLPPLSLASSPGSISHVLTTLPQTQSSQCSPSPGVAGAPSMAQQLCYLGAPR